MLPPNGSNRFWCTIFTLPSPATGVILKKCQPGAWLPLNTIYSIIPTILDLTFAFKGCLLEKNLITHSSLGASDFVITVSLMSLVFS